MDFEDIRDVLSGVIKGSPRSKMSALMALRVHRGNIDNNTILSVLREFYRQLHTSFASILKKMELQSGKSRVRSQRAAYHGLDATNASWPHMCSAMMEAITEADDHQFLDVERQNLPQVIECLDSLKMALQSFRDLHANDRDMRVKIMLVNRAFQNLGVLRSLLMERYREIYRQPIL